jgi:hypothetical protein
MTKATERCQRTRGITSTRKLPSERGLLSPVILSIRFRKLSKIQAKTYVRPQKLVRMERSQVCLCGIRQGWFEALAPHRHSASLTCLF